MTVSVSQGTRWKLIETYCTSKQKDPPVVDFRRVCLHRIVAHERLEETHDGDSSGRGDGAGDANEVVSFILYLPSPAQLRRIGKLCPRRHGFTGHEKGDGLHGFFHHPG